MSNVGGSMGWCGATAVFDVMAEAVLTKDLVDSKTTLLTLARILEEYDWDCQHDSDYFDHPIVQEIMKELHPNWSVDSD